MTNAPTRRYSENYAMRHILSGARAKEHAEAAAAMKKE
jgi:hypothetical protein